MPARRRRGGPAPTAAGGGTPARRAPADRHAVEVADRLHSAAIHLLRRVRREDAGAGLTAPQLSALSVIVSRGSLTLGDLARAEQVRPPTITRIVAALEAAGLAARAAHPGDRRIAVVTPTPRGTRLLEQGRRRRIAALAAEVVALPRADVAALERALDILERLVGPRMPHPR
jgi:DNA-binding MarR family transcriptional regulator